MTHRPIKTKQPQIHVESITALENLQTLSSGIYEIAAPLPIHASWTDRGADTTFVTFSAAVTRQAETVPIFSGAGTTAHLDANVLMLSDPSLSLDGGFNLAWYAGNCYQPTLQAQVTRVINAFRGNGRIVLFGASGGGYAALEQALRIPWADAIVANPQTDITKYSYYPTYLKLGWDGRYVPPSVPPIRTSVVNEYSHPVEARVIYIQNSGDTSHVDTHWAPFSAALHPENKVHLMDDYLGDGHVAPDGESFKNIFSAVCDNSAWEDITAALSSLTVTSRITAPAQA